MDPDAWHRLGMVVDLPAGTVCWYVDGAEVARAQNGVDGAVVVCDDRWALDATFSVFLDKDKPSAGWGHVLLGAFQVRAARGVWVGVVGPRRGERGGEVVRMRRPGRHLQRHSAHVRTPCLDPRRCDPTQCLRPRCSRSVVPAQAARPRRRSSP